MTIPGDQTRPTGNRPSITNGAVGSGPPEVSTSLGTRLYVAYGVGALGTSLFSGVPGLLLLFFMTNTLAIPAGLGGLAMFIGKFWDVVLDPAVGALSDRTRGRWGRRRPWMLAGALTLPVCFALLFHVPDLHTPLARWLWVLVFFTLSATAFAIFQIPYIAMPAEMTRDSHEQTVIMSWRMGFMVLGVLATGGLAPMLIQAGGGGRAGYAFMSRALACVCFASLGTAFLGTRNAPTAPADDGEVPLRTVLRAARENRPFCLLVAALFLQLTGIGALVSVVPYLATYALGGSAAVVSTLFVCLVGPAIVAMPVWVRIGRRIGKVRAYEFAVAGYALACLPLGLATAQSAWIAYGGVGIAGLAYAGTQLFPFSMLPDTMHAGHERMGVRHEGVLAGLFTASEKIGMAVGPMLAGMVLAATGFVESSGAAVTQPASALAGIRLSASLIPAALFLSSLVPLRFYERQA